MTDREKLINMIKGAVSGCPGHWVWMIADNLLDNGVTFATDTKVGDKWTPTAERLPEDGEIVLVYAKDEEHVVARWHKKWKEWENWNSQESHILRFEEVTHWMPLPEPPKED